MSPLDFFLLSLPCWAWAVLPSDNSSVVWQNVPLNKLMVTHSSQGVIKMLRRCWNIFGWLEASKWEVTNRGVPMSLENDNNISKILGIHKPMDTVMFPHPSFWLKSTLEQSPKWTSFSAMGFNLFPSLPQQTPVRVKCRQQFLRPDQKERRLRMWEPACEGKTEIIQG